MGGLRIGVNALYLIPGGVGGTEIYLRHLLEALGEIDTRDEFLVFTNAETGRDLGPARANFTLAPSRVKASFRPARILWEQSGLPLGAVRRRLDVLFNPGFTAPLWSPCPMVTVFHDLQHRRLPEHFRWFDLPFWRFLLWGSAHRSTLLLAVSESTRADLLREYRLPESRVRVVPEGVDPAFFGLAANPDQRDPYLLVVSTLHPHKNLELLLRAFADFRRRRPEYRLVVAGLRGFHAEHLERVRRDLRLEQAVEFTGWIPRSRLYRLYERASAFLYPSTFEGFGLPVLEAMAAGIPVACSDIEPLASHAGRGALRFDPHDRSAIAEAMLRLTSDEDLRAELAREGPRRAAEFSWHRAASLTLQAIRDAAGASASRR